MKEAENMSSCNATNAKVMLSIWVDAPLRDYVRARAMEAKQPVSEWAGNALRKAVLDTSLGAFCFPPGRCSARCDHDSQCTLSAGHGDRHETDHGCICYDPTREAK